MLSRSTKIDYILCRSFGLGTTQNFRWFTALFKEHASDHGYISTPSQLSAVQVLHGLVDGILGNQQRFQKLRRTLSQKPPVVSEPWLIRFGLRKQSASIQPRSLGAYIYGPVGQGKTVLLDLVAQFLFSELEPESILRCHYHHFMLALQQMLYTKNAACIRPLLDKLRSSTRNPPTQYPATRYPATGSPDFIETMAHEFVKNGISTILLDELQITNISDALIFKRLCTNLFRYGVTLICTSNCPIDRLYEGGLNRNRFVDFVDILKQNVVEIEIDNKIDLRTVTPLLTEEPPKLIRDDPFLGLTYITPGHNLDRISSDLTHIFDPSDHFRPLQLFHKRTMTIDYYSQVHGTAIASFDSLCGSATSPADFIAMARACPNGLWLFDVPILNLALEPEHCRRFVSLLDVIYDEHVPIVIHAQAPPLQLVAPVFPSIQVNKPLVFSIPLKTFDRILSSFDLYKTDIHTAWEIIFGTDKVTQTTWTNHWTRTGTTSAR